MEILGAPWQIIGKKVSSVERSIKAGFHELSVTFDDGSRMVATPYGLEPEYYDSQYGAELEVELYGS